MRNFDDFMVLVHYCDDYVKRSKDELTAKELIEFAMDNMLYIDDKCFMIYNIYKDELWLHYIYCVKGTGSEYTLARSEEICKHYGLKRIKILTKYPKALQRKLGFQIDQTLMTKEVN